MTDHEDLILFGSGLDQSLPTEDEFDGIKEMVDRRALDAIQNGDLDQATKLVRGLIKIAKISGKHLSRTLFQFHNHWDAFGSNETFEEWADREIGLHKHTVQRYIRVEELLNNTSIPAEVRKELTDRNMTELFPIANMMEQGYEPEPEQWEKIISQPDEVSIRETVRDIKGQEPRPTGLTLRMDEDGSLWAYRGGERFFFGSLNVEDHSPAVEQAIARVTRNAGILR